MSGLLSDGTGRWLIGSVAQFTYNCDTSDNSSHVDLRDRSPAHVVVIGPPDVEPGWEHSTVEERDAACMPWVYPIRFEDGYESAAFEDELEVVSE